MKPIKLALLLSLCLGMMNSYAVQARTFKAPNFKLPGISKTIELSHYRHKVVYVDFWASWCEPCKQSFPWMKKMQERYHGQGFKVIAIDLDAKRENGYDFLKKMRPNFTVAFDQKGEIAQNYGVQVMPTSFLINRRGDIAYVHRGFKSTSSDHDKIEARIKALVSK